MKENKANRGRGRGENRKKAKIFFRNSRQTRKTKLSETIEETASKMKTWNKNEIKKTETYKASKYIQERKDKESKSKAFFTFFVYKIKKVQTKYNNRKHRGGGRERRRKVNKTVRGESREQKTIFESRVEKQSSEILEKTATKTTKSNKNESKHKVVQRNIIFLKKVKKAMLCDRLSRLSKST